MELNKESIVTYDKFFQQLQSLVPKKYLTTTYLESQNKYMKNKNSDNQPKKGKKSFDAKEELTEKMTIEQIENIDVSLPDTSIQQLRSKIQDRLQKGKDRNAKIEQRRNEILEKKLKEKKEKPIKKKSQVKEKSEKKLKVEPLKVKKSKVTENMVLPELITTQKIEKKHTLPKKEKLKLDLAKAKRNDYQTAQLKTKLKNTTDATEKKEIMTTLKDKEWKKAMKRASGEKIRDDVDKIKKSIQVIDKKKEKTKKNWKKKHTIK